MLDTLCYIGYVTCSEQGTYSFTALDCEIMTAYKSNYNIWPSIRMSKIHDHTVYIGYLRCGVSNMTIFGEYHSN